MGKFLPIHVLHHMQKLNEKQQETQNNSQELFSTAQLEINKEKNRYYNILLYDSTRVKLAPIEGVAGSDYINASFVNLSERNYICCQAPLSDTIEDFHRMLWENNVETIVMLTRNIEDGRIKATDYLSALNEPKTFGVWKVDVLKEETHPAESAYIRRVFTLQKGEEKRTITQFHYMAWPDHGVPENTTPLRNMSVSVNELEEKNPKAPTVVHCSAGIGRTGTYIIINSILDEILIAQQKNAPPPAFNLMKIVHSVRSMRPGMVNAYDQYEFIYRTLLSHIQQQLAKNNESKK